MKKYYDLGNVLDEPGVRGIGKDEGSAAYAAILREVREGKAEIVPKPKVITYADINVIKIALERKDFIYKEDAYSIFDIFSISVLIDNFDLLLSNQNVIKSTASNKLLIFDTGKREWKGLNKADLIALRALILKRNQGIFLKSIEFKDKLDADTLTDKELTDWKNG